ncbi:class I adenylate-forming enzyme family protein [Salinifilum ghardaiensis]
MGSVYDERPWLALYEEGAPAELEPEHGTVTEMFDLAVRTCPDRVAVTYFDGRLTYRELDELSDGFADYLVEQGVEPGARIALYLQNTPQFVIALLGGWKAGAVVVPLNPMYRSHELTTILADSEPAVVVSSERGHREVLSELVGPAGVRRVVTTCEQDLQGRDDERVFGGSTAERAPADADLLALARQRAGRRPAGPRPSASDTALLVYTSGTSGVPKGATTTHGNFAFNAAGIQQRLSEGCGIFGLAPLFHITGMVCQLGAAIAVGGRLDLVRRFEPGVVLDALAEHRPQYMIGPSTAYVALMNHPEAGAEHFSSLEQLFSGGAPLPSAVVEDFRARFGHYIRNGYGLTETTATATSVPAHLEAPVDESSGTLSVGIPTFSSVLRIVGDDGADLPAGEVGEIVIEGPMVVPQYWNKPDETARGIPQGRLHTGDVGFMDQQGWFYVVDRKKDMISASGFKVWPREVEDVLYGHPAVREVAVVGVPDEYRGETVRAYVSLRDGHEVAEQDLVDHCRQRLAAYKYPRSVVVVGELPKTATGKILRRQLRDEARSGAATTR